MAILGDLGPKLAGFVFLFAAVSAFLFSCVLAGQGGYSMASSSIESIQFMLDLSVLLSGPSLYRLDVFTGECFISEAGLREAGRDGIRDG